MTHAELETLSMEILEGQPSKNELWRMATRLLAEVKRLREALDRALERGEQ